MDGTRHLSRWIAAVVAAALVGVAWVTPGAAPSWQALSAQSALDDPPDVRGLSVEDATKALQAWDRTVVIQPVPPQLPAGVDPSTVVVAAATLINEPTSPNIAVRRPIMRLTLGSRVPDLTGLTPAEAARALEPRGLRLGPTSAPTEPSWVVTAQQVPPGTIAEFGQSVPATFAAPATSFPPVVLVGAGLGLVLLVLATALGVRAALRRARRRLPGAPSAVRLEMHPGQVIGPELTELNASLSVRLDPHPDRGTLRMEEVPR